MFPRMLMKRNMLLWLVSSLLCGIVDLHVASDEEHCCSIFFLRAFWLLLHYVENGEEGGNPKSQDTQLKEQSPVIRP